MSELGQNLTSSHLLDHLVSAGKQLRRDRQSKFFRSLEIDHECELRGLFDREIGWIGSLEYLIDIDCRLHQQCGIVGTITEKPTRNDKPVHLINGGKLGRCS